MIADAAELMDGRERTDGRVIVDVDVPRQRGVVREDRVRANVAIVRDVRVGHEEVVRLDRGPPTATGRAAINRNKFSYYIIITNY